MRCTPRGDHGTATAEIAVALPSLALVLGIALASVQAVTTHLACVDAARAGARAFARGEDEHAVRSLVAEIAPARATVELSTDATFARVSVSTPVRLAPGGPRPFDVRARAVTPIEPRGEEPTT